MSLKQQGPRLLPAALIEARRRHGVSQKALALDAAVNISHLCTLERGRRRAPTSDLVSRLVKALGMDEPGAKALRFAGAHDRAIESLADVLGPGALRLISAAAKAGFALQSSEAAGAEEYLNDLIRSRAVLTAAAARGADTAPREDAMT